MYHTIKTTLKNNKKVIENYSFMTLLQFASIFIGLITYPYVIGVLGTALYGLYIFILSFSMLFGVFVSFSVDMLATKEIAQNFENKQKKSEILSSIFFLRLFLFGFSFVGLLILSLLFQFVSEYLLLYILCFMININAILFHTWYFQGIQKMKIVTYIKVGCKILTLPFIFLCINNKNDLILYIIIVVLSDIIGSCYGFYYLLTKEKVKIYWCGFNIIKSRLLASLPFFYKNVLGEIRGQAVPQIMGAYIGLHEVALFDLAKKIVGIPYSLVININNALFPKLAQYRTEQMINKLFKYEAFVGLFCIISVFTLGSFAVEILGGKVMAESYYLTVILSVIILLDLLIGIFFRFIFILEDKTYLIFQAQIVAFVSFFTFIFISLYFYNSIYVFAMGTIIAGIAELVFCYWISKVGNKRII